MTFANYRQHRASGDGYTESLIKAGIQSSLTLSASSAGWSIGTALGVRVHPTVGILLGFTAGGRPHTVLTR